MRRRKPMAYLERKVTGWFMLEVLYTWVAEDTWGNTIARCRTRKECEAECRRAGYVPVR